MLVKVERIHVTFEGSEIAQTLRIPENPQIKVKGQAVPLPHPSIMFCS